MTPLEFIRRLPRLVAALPAGTEVRPLDLAADPPAVEPVPDSAEARAAVAAFDWSDAGQQQWEDGRQPERTALRQQAAAAVQANADYLAVNNPTAAQVRDQVRALTQQNNAIIRRLVQLD